MKKILINGLLLATAVNAFAGNPDRRGESGALELNMNGYGRTAGLWGLNAASIKGLEAERLNPAGLAYTRNTEVAVAYTSWLTGSGVSLIQGGIAQRIKSHAFAISVNAVNFGSIERTTVASPEGGLGQFKPTFFNLGLSYAKNFSLGSTKLTGDNVITGGITVRFLSEGIEGISSFGFGFDAGLQYTTGKKENFHFGVSLRNVGTSMKFRGDGFAVNGATDADYTLQVDRKSAKYELPIQLNIALAYDIWLGAKKEVAPGKYTQNVRLTPMVQYSANAYGNDNFGPGLEFSFKEIFMLRAAYRMEPGVFKNDTRTTAYNGLAVGTSINVPFKKDGTGASLGIDYGYRMTALNTNFSGTHTVGLRFNLGNPKPKEKAEETSAKAAYNDEDVSADKAEKKSSSKKAGKKTASVELVEKQQVIDSLLKANEALKVKAETPVIKVDTVKVIEKVAVPVELEKTDYKGGNIDTLVIGGRKTLRFNDYDKIQFESNSTILSKTSTSYLNYLVNQMKLNPGGNLVLSGHTDNVGDDAKNKQLSNERAQAVKNYVVSKGVSEERITTYGFGADLPKYVNNSETARAKNRRVEVDIVF